MKNQRFANRRRWLLLSLVLTAVVLTSYFLYRRQPAVAAAKPSADTATAVAASPAPAGELEFLPEDLLTLEPVALSRGVDVSGPLIAVTQALARAKVAGELVSLTVREGDSVKAGQVIGTIDSTEATARQKERQALLASAQAQLDNAVKTLENNRNLLEKGFVSQAVVDTSTANVDVARAQRDAAKAQLQVADKQLGDTRILAPVTGIVAERLAQPGERVSIDARIVNVVDPRKLEVQAALPAAEVARVRTGLTAEITVEGLDQPRRGQVTRIAPAALGGARSVPVFIAVDGPDDALRPGLYAKGRIETGAAATVLAIPQSAIRDQSGRQVVYRISADGRLTAATVQTGLTGRAGPKQETWVEITDGLSAGDRIVGPNLGTLREGATVRIRSNA